MGWNKGGIMFEAQVIGLYNLGKLDKEVLKVIALPYAKGDVDFGDAQDKSHDGKSLSEIVVEVMGELPKCPEGKRVYSNEWTQWDKYYEEVYEKFRTILKDNFGWDCY